MLKEEPLYFEHLPDEFNVLVVSFHVPGSFQDERNILQFFIVQDIVEKILAQEAFTKIQVLVLA